MRARLMKAMLTVALLFGGATAANMIVLPGTAAACGSIETGTAFFNIRPWYNGLTIYSGSTELCKPVATTNTATLGSNEIALSTFVWKVVFNAADILLTLIGYAAVLFVLVGGAYILFSSGDPSKVAKGKATIGNALMGVVIAVCAGGIVRFINDTLITGSGPNIVIGPDGLEGSTGPATTTMWANAASNFMFMIGIAAVAMVVWSGVKLSSSSGDPQAQAKAKNSLIFALIGVVIMAVAGSIVRWVFGAVDQGSVTY